MGIPVNEVAEFLEWHDDAVVCKAIEAAIALFLKECRDGVRLRDLFPFTHLEEVNVEGQIDTTKYTESFRNDVLPYCRKALSLLLNAILQLV